MSVLKSRLEPDSAEFRDNARAMQSMIAALREKHARVREGGDAAARVRHVRRG